MLRRLTKIAATQLRSTATAPTSTTAATITKDKWDLYAGVLVERLPILSRTLNPLERQVQEMLWRVEFENSLKSNHELHDERDQRQAELFKKGELEVDLDEHASTQTAQDLKDAYTEELKQLKLAPRTTADDAANNTRSTKRCLEDTLYLLVEQQLGQQQHLLLPQGPRLDGETMRQTAERVLQERCGDQLRVQFYGHAPCGFYKYKYPRSMRTAAVGAKVFFYRAAWRAGNVTEQQASGVNAFEWLARSAFEAKLPNADYADSVQRFLL